MNLLQLFLNNQKAPKALRISASANEASIYLYDVIGGDWFGGIKAADAVRELAALQVDTIHLRINSPGGDVFEARAIVTALRQHSAKVIAHIDGLAASAASFIALAADEVEIAPGAFVMIHNGWTLAMGDKAAMAKAGDLLTKFDEGLIAEYAQETGNEPEQVRAWMEAETWFEAEEAIQHGFADRLMETGPSARNTWNLTAYSNTPASLARAPAPEALNVDREALERRLALLERIAP